MLQAELFAHTLTMSCLWYFSDSRKCHQPVQEHLSETRRFKTEDDSTSVPRPAKPVYSSTPAQTW